jgi:hypothetical protein
MEALRRSVGGATAESKASKKPVKKGRKAAAGQKGDADADRRQEAGEGGGDEETGGQAAAQVRLSQSRRAAWI